MTSTTTPIRDWFLEGFRQAVSSAEGFERRVGAELKFPLVHPDGSAVPRETVDRLWHYLIEEAGWQPETDSVGGHLVGARTPGPRNDTVASCETGYCKTEFSLAHGGDLHELAAQIEDLRGTLRAFSEREGAFFLAYGIHPVTPPGRHLLMKKERASFWDRAMPHNNVIPEAIGDDVHLFTVNAGSHVHVGVTGEEAARAVDVLNGFAGAQIALMADSSVWRGEAVDEYQDVAEALWDWWEAAAGRSGVPAAPYGDLAGYVGAIEALAPVYVRRDGEPIIVRRHYDSFAEYFNAETATGLTLDGREVSFAPAAEDLARHNSCYWYTARISQYYTVENRACDQQPPEALLAPAALTLGLVTKVDEAWEALRQYRWTDLVEARKAACRTALQGTAGELSLRELAGTMLAIAEAGLAERGRDEESFLAPLQRRLEAGECPADEARVLWREGGAEALIRARAL
jgi:gamma-glutamylcysteine synthetase